MAISPFATFLIIGPTCFFLGILFASFPYDYFVLWSTPTAATPPPPMPTIAPDAADGLEPHLAVLEQHIRMLHAAPPLISRILHLAIGTGLIGLLTKLYKPSEANMLFDGASLVLYVVGITVYITNMLKGMRVVSAGVYGMYGADMTASKFAADNERLAAEAASAGKDPAADVLGRADTLRVFAASNTILALVLVGVLILQAGQWYAQKKEAAEIEAMDRDAKKKAEGAVASGGADKKKQ